MKTGQQLHIHATLMTMLGVALLAIGCESDDDDSAATNAPPGTASTPALVLSPVRVSFNAPLATNISFTATGGQGNFSWAVGDTAIGTLVASGGNAIYTSTTNAGQNSVTVTDGGGTTATATINQN